MRWTYIDDVLVDAAENESPTFSNEISSKPLEDGTVVTDHINNEPDTFTLDIVITGENGKSAQEKYERLLEIRNNREIITVVGALQVYENMAISEMSLEKNSENAKGYNGSISFQQVKFAKPQTIDIEVAPPVINDEEQSSPEEESEDSDKRDSKSEEVDEETINNKSFLEKILESLEGSN